MPPRQDQTDTGSLEPEGSGRIVRLAEAPGSTGTDPAQASPHGHPDPPPFLGAPANARGAWLLAPVLLVGVVIGAVFVSRTDVNLFGWAFGLLLFAGIGWVVVSVFFPPKTDRQCPECGEVALARMDPNSTRGVRCKRCGFQDETRSAFLMAEEEGPFESAVLEDRKRQTNPTR